MPHTDQFSGLCVGMGPLSKQFNITKKAVICRSTAPLSIRLRDRTVQFQTKIQWMVVSSKPYDELYHNVYRKEDAGKTVT